MLTWQEGILGEFNTNIKMAPRVGLEPTTNRLTAGRSAC